MQSCASLAGTCDGGTTFVPKDRGDTSTQVVRKISGSEAFALGGPQTADRKSPACAQGGGAKKRGCRRSRPCSSHFSNTGHDGQMKGTRACHLREPEVTRALADPWAEPPGPDSCPQSEWCQAMAPFPPREVRGKWHLPPSYSSEELGCFLSGGVPPRYPVGLGPRQKWKERAGQALRANVGARPAEEHVCPCGRP